MATTLREILDSLKDEDRRLLQYAFENQIAQFVKLENNQYIGVHCKGILQLEPSMESGVWSSGTVKGQQ